MLIAGAGVIAVGMGDHRALDGAPGVDIEITRRAIKTFGARDNKVHGVTRMGGLLAMRLALGWKFYRIFMRVNNVGDRSLAAAR